MSTTAIYSKEELVLALNKALRGKSVPENYKAAITSGDGDGALQVPTDLHAYVLQEKKNFKSMKQYVDVIPVKTESGTHAEDDTSQLAELFEINEDFPEITEQDIKFKGMKWEIKPYASFTQVPDSLFRDAKYDLFEIFKRSHAERATITENKLIFKAVKTLTPKALVDTAALSTSLNKDLNPAYEKEILIVTNQDGFEVLKTHGQFLSDGEGPNLKYYFDKYLVEVYDNATLPTVTGNAPVLYGSFKRGVKFFDAEKVDILLKDYPFGIRVPVHAMRGIEAFDVKLIPGTKDVLYGQIPTT